MDGKKYSFAKDEAKNAADELLSPLVPNEVASAALRARSLSFAFLECRCEGDGSLVAVGAVGVSATRTQA